MVVRQVALWEDLFVTLQNNITRKLKIYVFLCN